MTESATAAKGVILACRDYAHICGYRCCDQAGPDDPDNDPTNSILLYPGEAAASNRSRRHLAIYDDSGHGARARCQSEAFDQASCDSERNFKPLDCQSYPFFPTIADGQLGLLKDTRCPLPHSVLQEHYHCTVHRWRELIGAQAEIGTWIAGVMLNTYERFHPEER